MNDDRIQSLYSVAVRNKYDGLMNYEEGNEEEELGAEEQFNALRDALESANREILAKVERQPRRPWMTGEILNMMDERRMYKTRDVNKYNQLNRKIHKKCLKAKEEWMTEKCEEIEQLEKVDQQRMYSKIKEIKGRKQKYKNNISIKKADSTVAMEMDEVKERWNEYIQELFRDQRPETLNLSTNDDCPTLLKS